MDEHEATAADVAGARQGNGKGKTNRHGGIDGVTTLLQDVAADGRGERFLRGDHAVFRPDGMLNGVFGVDGFADDRRNGRRSWRRGLQRDCLQ